MFVIVELFAKAVLDDPEEPNIVVNSIEEYEDESPYIFFIKETSFMNIFQVWIIKQSGVKKPYARILFVENTSYDIIFYTVWKRID